MCHSSRVTVDISQLRRHISYVRAHASEQCRICQKIVGVKNPRIKMCFSCPNGSNAPGERDGGGASRNFSRQICKLPYSNFSTIKLPYQTPNPRTEPLSSLALAHWPHAIEAAYPHAPSTAPASRPLRNPITRQSVALFHLGRARSLLRISPTVT